MQNGLQDKAFRVTRNRERSSCIGSLSEYRYRRDFLLYVAFPDAAGITDVFRRVEKDRLILHNAYNRVVAPPFNKYLSVWRSFCHTS